jgi:PPOX class probable F420-dependent enzyme
VSATAKRLTKQQIDLLNEQHFATVATLMPDGSPHATVVWIESDGEFVYFNTAAEVKSRNLRHDNRVSITVFDPSSPYDRVLSIRGVAELVYEGANDHMNQLSQKYTGHLFDGFRPGERRMIVRVTPTNVH